MQNKPVPLDAAALAALTESTVGQELPRVLRTRHASLRQDGVLFASNPRGDNVEGFNGERYGSYLDRERWNRLVTACGFAELEHYYRPPGRPRAEQPWLATVFRKR